MTLTREQITEVLAGLDGVTPGKWFERHGQVCSYQEDREFSHIVDVTGLIRMPKLDAAHIARCDPSTIRAVLTELLALRAENERLRSALKPFADIIEPYGRESDELWGPMLRLHHYRAAKAALERKEK